MIVAICRKSILELIHFDYAGNTFELHHFVSCNSSTFIMQQDCSKGILSLKIVLDFLQSVF